MTEEEKRLYAEERLRLLSEVTEEFSAATRDYRRLLDVIARRLSAVVGELCVVRLARPDGETLEPAGSIGHPDPEVVELARELLIEGPVERSSTTLAGRVLLSGSSVYLPEVDPRQYAASVEAGQRHLAERLAVRSAIFVPLLAERRVIGVLTMIRSAPENPYGKGDLELVQELARHAALAIANGRLFDAAERLTVRQRLLSELTREFARSTGNYHELLDLIARRLGEILGETCLVRMVPPEGEHFASLKGLYHPDESFALAWREFLNAHPQRIDEGMTGHVLRTGNALLIATTSPDELAHPIEHYRAIIERLGIRSVMAVPLRAEGNPIGVVAMTRSDPAHPYTKDDLQLLEDITSHASIALTNGLLLDQAQRDLAERKRAEAHLRETEAQLRQAQKMEAVGRLAGGVAHDFNNILSVILGHATLIIEDLPVDSPVRADLEEIRTASQSAAALTAQLLAFSRQQIIQPSVLDLNELLASLENMNRRLLGEDIEYRTITTPELDRVKADQGHIEQVILNLIVNARDAMPRGGHLTLETQNVELDSEYAREHLGVTPGAHVMLAVSDTGVGMDRETQQRIFEPFFTTKPRGKGTGLGLSTVFGIINQSGGSIYVYSEPGHGTTFKVYLPRTTEVAPKISHRPPPLTLDGSELVLLVEDDPQVRAVTRLVLSRSGYRVVEACNGADALGLAESVLEPIDLLVTDVVMPSMGGRELADRLKLLRPALKVLYMSGYTDDAIVHHRVLDPGVALLQKPVTPDALLSKVRAILDARR